jgi:hypothetical protein
MSMDPDNSSIARKKLAECIETTSAKMKSKLMLGSNGICIFKNDRNKLEFAIELPEGSDLVYFYSPICRVPYDFTEQFFERVLESNLHGIATNQACFGLDKETQNIVLTYSIAMGYIDAVSFENILFNFIKTAEKAVANTIKWIEEIAAQNTLSDGDPVDEVVIAAKNIKMRV